MLPPQSIKHFTIEKETSSKVKSTFLTSIIKLLTLV